MYVKKMMYVLTEYYKSDPSRPEVYYRNTREECEQLEKELLYEDEDDVDEIIISDEPEEVELWE